MNTSGIRPRFLKTVTIVVGLIVTAVGCAAHFDSYATEVFNRPGASDMCKNIDHCPGYAMSMEKFFVSITIICLILSVVNLIVGFIVDLSGYKVVDSSYHIGAGIFIILAGILMIVSAAKLDRFFIPNATHDNVGINAFTKAFPGLDLSLEIHRSSNPILDDAIKHVRQRMKYLNKLFAGTLAIVNGMIYFVTVAVIYRNKTNVPILPRNRKF